MQLGISSYAYGWAVAQGQKCFDEHTLLDRARDFGLGLVQFGDHIPLARFDSARLNRLKLRAQSEGIALEVGGRGLTRDNLSRHIKVCEMLGARLLRFVIDEGEYKPSVEESTAIVREHSAQLEADGITLGIENHDRFGCRTLQRIVQEVQSPSVGICLDTANSLGAGEGLREVLQVLGESAVNLHLKDFAIVRVPYAMGFVVEGRAAGEGMMDAPHLLREAARWNRCASAVVETWVPPEPDVEATLRKEREWAERSVKYLQKFPRDN